MWYGYCLKEHYIVSFLQGTLNDTSHCEVIIYFGLSSILCMIIHNKIIQVIMQESTVNSTVKILYSFIDKDTVSFLEDQSLQYL